MRTKFIHVFVVALAILMIAQMYIGNRPVAAAAPPEYGKIIWFVQIAGPGGPVEPITAIQPCKWYRVVSTEPLEPGFTPPPCSWWHIFWPEQLYCIWFHVDTNGAPGEFHIDRVSIPGEGPVVPPVSEAKAEWKRAYGVGGIDIPVDKLALLTPYIGGASTIIVAMIATAASVVYVKRRKEKQ